MEKVQKTIFISISRGTLVRNILRTDVLKELLKQNYRVVIIVSVKIHDYFKKEFNYENIVLEKVEEKHYNKLRKFITIMMSALVYTETERRKIKFGGGNKQPNSNLVSWIKHITFSLLSKVIFLRYSARWAESFFYKDIDYDYLFKKYTPDLVFCSSLYSSVDLILMKAAKRLNVVSVSMPKSWDTVGRLFFRTVADKIILNNSFMKEWVLKEQLIKKEDMYVCGMPQFDVYAKKDTYLNKDDFCQKTGLDKTKPIILYASEGLWTHWDEVYVDDLIKNHSILEKYNLILRPHFSNIDQKLYHRFKKYKNIYIDDKNTRVTNMFTDKWDVTEENVDWLAEVINASDVVVTFVSTFVLDAFIFDKPVINIYYDLFSESKRFLDSPVIPMEELYDCFHYNTVLAEKSTTIAQSGRDVMQWIKRYLKNPDILSLERKKTVDKLCYKTDGKSARRIANVIISLVN